ncbi:MAG: Holliday junction resolvase YqgF, putative holliday junction resolvase [Parcubacteria group bacterium]|nr:Holliday junction resolvase YqgF, putative holliday junction resolvase [Parcubacteria group bacterium]
MIMLDATVIYILYYTYPMKLLAVDYGAKRVGIASTDEAGEFAIPRAVLPNDEKLVPTILDAVAKYKVERIILGESSNFAGKPNEIMNDAHVFADKLRQQGVEVVFHPEVFTSMEADRLQGRTDMRDASAAALILKSYIDTEHNKQETNA